MESLIQKNWQPLVAEIIERRQKLKLTQKQLSQLSGVSQSTISRIEHAETGVELEHILRVLFQLGLTLTFKK